MPSLTRRLHFGHHLNAPRTEKWRLPCMFIARCVVWMYGGGSRLVMCLWCVGNQVWVHLLPLLRWAETDIKPICRPAVHYSQLVGPRGSLGIALMVRGMRQGCWCARTSFCLLLWYFHFYWSACYARYFICMTLIVRLWSGCVSAQKLLLLCCCIFISMCAVSDTPPPISLYRACACASFYICVMYKNNGVVSYSKSRVCVIISHPE